MASNKLIQATGPHNGQILFRRWPSAIIPLSTELDRYGAPDLWRWVHGFSLSLILIFWSWFRLIESEWLEMWSIFECEDSNIRNMIHPRLNRCVLHVWISFPHSYDSFIVFCMSESLFRTRMIHSFLSNHADCRSCATLVLGVTAPNKLIQEGGPNIGLALNLVAPSAIIDTALRLARYGSADLWRWVWARPQILWSITSFHPGGHCLSMHRWW